MKDGVEKTDRLIVLMSDFGLRDPFAGIMKGVILSINAEAKIVDLTHDIDPFNIVQGAMVLKSTYEYFPRGSIFVAVVDPTVGSSRKGLLVEAGGRFFVGPDNGILWSALEDVAVEKFISLKNEKYFSKKVSSTFHGRDIFAPAAAWLSLGTESNEFGPIEEDPVRLNLPRAGMSDDHIIRGEILFSDRFGNLATNVSGDLLELGRNLSGNREPCISAGNKRIAGITTHYSDPTSQDKGLMALVNSWGYLEIFLPMDSAEEQSGMKRGDTVLISFP